MDDPYHAIGLYLRNKVNELAGYRIILPAAME